MPEQQASKRKQGRPPAPTARCRIEGFERAFASAFIRVYPTISEHAARLLAIRMFDWLDDRRRSSSELGRCNTINWVEEEKTGPTDQVLIDMVCGLWVLALCCGPHTEIHELLCDVAEMLTEHTGWPGHSIALMAGARFLNQTRRPQTTSAGAGI